MALDEPHDDDARIEEGDLTLVCQERLLHNFEELSVDYVRFRKAYVVQLGSGERRSLKVANRFPK